MKKLAVALGMAFVLLAGPIAEANGGHHRGGGHRGGGYYGGGHHGGGYYRGGYGWGGGWGGGWGYGWGGGLAVYPRVFIGGPYGWGNPYPYYSQPYYSQPTVIERSQPEVYVQQPGPEPRYWYYCENPRGYYPSVESCRNEWLQVVPRTDSPDE